MEVFPLKNYVPRELTLSPLSFEEADRQKRGMEDSDLQQYYTRDIVQVYDVEEANEYWAGDGFENIRYESDLVIEKTPERQDKAVHELAYGILMDELGASVPILYARLDEDTGNLKYGMPFRWDAGQIQDIEFNGFEDFIQHAEGVGEAYGPIYDADVIHEDLIGSRRGGKMRHTPYLRNMLISGALDGAEIIDLEDAHFTEDPSPKQAPSKHMAEMNPQTRDDEYDAILSSLVCEALEKSTYLNSLAQRPIEKPDFVQTDEETGLDYVDINKLLNSEVATPEFNDEINRLTGHFETGWHNGQLVSPEFYRAQQESTIPRTHKREDTVKEASRSRLRDDIEPALTDWLE